LIFVDTTFWIGDADVNDDFHASSLDVVEAIRKSETSVAVTTDFVLNETVTILGRRKAFGPEKASKAASIILSSPRVLTVFIDESLLKETLELYPTYRGKLGVTDVSSVAVMKKYGLREIYSHDRDFDSVTGVKRLERTVVR
jgi:predicted nucleic acid-binding protein